MARRMRALDWPRTPLGAVETSPQSLRSTLGTCVESRFPIAIYWGPDLTLLYNDAWSPIPGTKHPWALGRPATSIILRILAAVRRSPAAPRACHSRQRTSAWLSERAAVWSVIEVPSGWPRTWSGEGRASATS